MSVRRWNLLLPAFCVACAGVSVRPDDADASALPTVSLSTADSEALASLVRLAIESLERRHDADAEHHARRALELDPRSARARAVLGASICRQSALDDPPDLLRANAGEAELILASRLAPADPFVGWLHASMLADAGHLSAAAATAEAALQRTTGAPAAERSELIGVAGTCRYELGEERAALPHLQAYVAIRPDDATASFRLGVCLLRLAETPTGPRPNSLVVAQSHAEAAARAFGRCAELAPGDADAALAGGAALLRAAELAAERRDQAAADERRQAAEQQFRDVAARFPANAEALFRAGVVAELRGDDAAARQDYLAALARDPNHLGSLLNLAACHERSDGPAADASVRELLQRALQVGVGRGALSTAERDRIRTRLGA
jgi:tetratricopeptide (TPR) repeat protein